MRDKSGSLAAKVAAIAARQHGIVSRGQLLDLGFAGSTIHGWLRAGHLHRLHLGVYSVGHTLVNQEGRWLAAILACGPGSFLSHGPAGQLQGIVSRRERLALHVSVASSDRRPKGIVTHRPRSLDPRDTTTRLRIPTTTPTRTVWDLATTLPPLQTRRAFEQAEKLHLLIRPRLAQLLAASPSRKGAGTIRELLADRPLPLAETRSWLEELLLRICRDHGLPVPAVSVPLLGYEVDFLWPAARFVVEADGSDHLDPGRRDQDNERDIALGRAGYLVRRYSYRAMGREAAVAAEVLEILVERLRR
jgi:very-short-patch-repair endonuclease